MIEGGEKANGSVQSQSSLGGVEAMRGYTHTRRQGGRERWMCRVNV